MPAAASSSRSRLVAAACGVVLLVAASCSGEPETRDSIRGDADTTFDLPQVDDGSIVVAVDGDSVPFDRRVLGSNAPAWISPAVLVDPAFHDKIVDMGATVLRMPGGSWSSEYDWLACEQQNGCNWGWAARPSDFVELLLGTGLEGMWTVSFNGTAEEAAALVAFFNADVDDTRVIGLDRRGRDWGTVGQWATLRSDGGHPEPVNVDLWEVGNEVFGARPEAGSGCADFGWEVVWTCDGAEYVAGDAEHDGFLRFREEMLAVDPSIEIGAVGIGGGQDGWGNFGNEVIEGAAGQLDFYVVHDYGFNETAPVDEVLARPSDDWPDTLDDARAALAGSNSGAAVPIAVTEYNMFAFHDGDTEGMMAEAISAFYIADTIGQMALNGVGIANQWNLVNGMTESGSDYGIFDAVTGAAHPSFYAMNLWSRFGEELVPVAVGADLDDGVQVYAGRSADGSITLLVLNQTDSAATASIELDGVVGSLTGTAHVMTAASLDAREVQFNGELPTSTDLDEYPPADIGPVAAGRIAFTFEPFSLTLLTFAPSEV